jgi:hypothetical protein
MISQGFLAFDYSSFIGGATGCKAKKKSAQFRLIEHKRHLAL